VASQLNGLFRTLSWSDFRTVQSTPPTADAPADAANTQVKIGLTGVQLYGDDPTSMTLNDTIVVTISFDAANSTKGSWIVSQSQASQAALLAHEQGHYNIGALLGRDYFLRIMALKGKTYSSSADLQTDLDAASAATITRLQEISDDYDTGTTHGMDPTGQATWLGFIQKAFTQPRTPFQNAADGKPIKVELVDVLSAAGAI
jgi:hypothetical protein